MPHNNHAAPPITDHEIPSPVSHLNAIASVWASLANDTGAVVLIVDRDGVVHWHNEVAAQAEPVAAILRRGAGRLTFHDFMQREVADERIEMIRRTLDSGAPVTMDGWCWGQRRCTTLRPIPNPDGGPPTLVLNTCVPRSSRGFDPTQTGNLTQEDRGNLDQLTDRETEVLTLIARGMTTQQIADQLGRSVKTVEWHRLSLGNKLSVTNRVELAQIAIHAGLVDIG